MVHSAVKRWPIIQDLLKREGIARHHLSSFDDFLDKGLQNIVDEIGDITINNPEFSYKVRLGKIKLQPPRMMEFDGSITQITLSEARLRKASYCAPLMLEISIVQNRKVVASRFVHVGDMPVMAKSKNCLLHDFSIQQLINAQEDPQDPGGYFVINGSERIIVGLEDLFYNKIIVDKETVGDNIVYKAKAQSAIVGYRAKIELIMKHDGLIAARIPGSPVDIPLIILMRALGLESDRDIATVVSLVDDIQDELNASFEQSDAVTTSKDAILYISKRTAPGMLEEFQVRRAESLLDWGLLPHLGKNKENRKEKAQFLGETACKLLELKLGWITPDDKDHYGNKIVKFGGELLADLFRNAFRNLVKDIKYQLERPGQIWGIHAVAGVVRPGTITDKLNNAIATGNWGRGRVGVTQSLDRTNYLSTIGHLRRLQSPLSRSQAHFEARDVHPTYFGRMCPSETPEGGNCGLVKNLALSGIVSVEVSNKDVIEKLYTLGTIHVLDAKEDLQKDGTRIFVDGRLIGYHNDGVKLAESFRDLRRSSKIHPHVGVSFNKPTIKGATKRLFVDCNACRVIRPLIIIKNDKALLTQDLIDKVSKKLLSWTDLLRMGIMELMDAAEEENCYVALDEKDVKGRTHLEIFPPAILSAVASIIPFPEHNQSPRITYESAMAKQSLGFSYPMMATGTYVRQHLMLYPQVPIVHTRAMKLLGLEDRPFGQNCVVAVIPFDGYNIEDAIVLSKPSIDRGLGRTFSYRIYNAEGKQYPNGMRDIFEIPRRLDEISGYKGEHAYKFLEEDGVIGPEIPVEAGEILIGKTSPPRFIGEHKDFEDSVPHKRDTSIGVKPAQRGVVDSIILTQTNEGGKMYRVRVRDMRVPEIGDKFASRHGQKGVCGFLAKAEDLPYTASGMSPDVMINPHAFPSRMTVGMLLESMCGKAASLRGTKFDGSAFVGEKMPEVKKVLEEHGFKLTGKETMYDGRTGAPFKVDIFIGVVYYQKLQHMVADKMHARARGSVQMLTKQPTAGKAKGGGLRFGEMERDCIIAYGASMILKDRLLDESDRSDMFVCERCGLVAYHDVKLRRYVCRVCGNKGRVSSVSVAFAFKLLLQEIMGLNITPRLLIKDKV